MYRKKFSFLFTNLYTYVQYDDINQIFGRIIILNSLIMTEYCPVFIELIANWFVK